MVTTRFIACPENWKLKFLNPDVLTALPDSGNSVPNLHTLSIPGEVEKVVFQYIVLKNSFCSVSPSVKGNIQ